MMLGLTSNSAIAFILWYSKSLPPIVRPGRDLIHFVGHEASNVSFLGSAYNIANPLSVLLALKVEIHGER
jgi:hypothetical protein